MGNLRKAFQLFLKQTKTLGKEKVTLAGQDHLGNKYFEVHRPNNDRKIHRYFEKPNIDSFDLLIDAAQVPPCWDAWLRFRRQQPPTKQEVEESEEYYRMQQKRAADRKKDESQLNEQQENQKRPATIGDTKEVIKKVPPGFYRK